MPNRLNRATSPYLRQHADNPVDWWEWGAPALEAARGSGKPILLSIGYAACHWCHVMAHESFEDAETAAIMNEHFVNIKVDREERPDLDSIYMQAVQALTGQGGWPMTVFLTPEGVPFHGGTYFPPQDRHGLPSFRRVLLAISEAWRNKQADVRAAGAALRDHLLRLSAPEPEGESPTAVTFDLAFRALARSFDQGHAGFGGAPKFPPTMALDFLLRHWAWTGEPLALDMVRRTHEAMRRGGIFDQVGGGIHRYSVDDTWLVPHFEKMLYDNALFARLGVFLWQATGDPDVRWATERTLDWVVREMRDPGGGFHSSLDADSEGHEGRFYVWDHAEFVSVAGTDADLATALWGVTPDGNFEGRNILHAASDVSTVARRAGADPDAVNRALERVRDRLLAVRDRRTRPARDDKVIASWNGLMCRAFAEAARVFRRDDYRNVAQAAGDWLSGQMVRDGRVTRSMLGGDHSGDGFLEDHAAVALAFLDLHALTFEAEWLARSRSVLESAIQQFRDPGADIWYDTASGGESLLIRPRETTDNALPSGTSLMAELLQRWAELDGREDYRAMALSIVSQAGTGLTGYPLAYGHLAGVAESLATGTVQVALSGDLQDPGMVDLSAALAKHFVPSLVIAVGESGTEAPVALLRDRLVDPRPTAFVCRDYVCNLPTSDPAELERLLETAGPSAARGAG